MRPSNHLWQIWAPRTANVVEVHRLLTRAIGRDLVRPFEQFGVDTVTLDQPIKAIPPATTALVALDVEHLELADYCRSRKMIAPSRQRFTPPSQGELKFTHGSASAAVVAPVVRPGAYQFCRNDLDAVSVGRFGPIVTAKHHSHPSHRSTRSICDLFKISSINSLPINNHRR